MPKPVIKIENLSKPYRLGEMGTGTISHDLNRWRMTKISGKEDPIEVRRSDATTILWNVYKALDSRKSGLKVVASLDLTSSSWIVR